MFSLPLNHFPDNTEITETVLLEERYQKQVRAEVILRTPLSESEFLAAARTRWDKHCSCNYDGCFHWNGGVMSVNRIIPKRWLVEISYMKYRPET